MSRGALIRDFETLLEKKNVLTAEVDRQSYSYDSAVPPPVIPSMVIRPRTTEQIGQIVTRCYDLGVPMTVRGAGSNPSGGTIPDSTGFCVILTNGLNKILEINEQDLYAVMKPRVVTAQFAAKVAKRGLFYSPAGS